MKSQGDDNRSNCCNSPRDNNASKLRQSETIMVVNYVVITPVQTRRFNVNELLGWFFFCQLF